MGPRAEFICMSIGDNYFVLRSVIYNPPGRKTAKRHERLNADSLPACALSSPGPTGDTAIIAVRSKFAHRSESWDLV